MKKHSPNPSPFRKLNTGISILPELWDQKLKQIVYLNRKQARDLLPSIDFDLLPLADDVKKMNVKLSMIKTGIEELNHLNELKKVAYSSESILEDYKDLNKRLTKKEEASDLVFDYIDKYIVENAPSRVKGSLSVYKSLKTHLKSYEVAKRIKVKFSNMDYDFIQSFQNFLFEHVTIKERTLNNITVAKQLSTLKTFLGYAKRSGISFSDGYKDFIIKRQKLEVIALNEEEFYRIYNLDLKGNDRLDRVRDIFASRVWLAIDTAT